MYLVYDKKNDTPLRTKLLTRLEPQSRFGDKALEICLVCPHNGTAVLKGLTGIQQYTRDSSQELPVLAKTRCLLL